MVQAYQTQTERKGVHFVVFVIQKNKRKYNRRKCDGKNMSKTRQIELRRPKDNLRNTKAHRKRSAEGEEEEETRARTRKTHKNSIKIVRLFYVPDIRSVLAEATGRPKPRTSKWLALNHRGPGRCSVEYQLFCCSISASFLIYVPLEMVNEIDDLFTRLPCTEASPRPQDASLH